MNTFSVSHMHNIRFEIAVAVLAVGLILGVVTKFFV